MKKHLSILLVALLLLSLVFTSCAPSGENHAPISLESVPAYKDKPFVAINGNIPFFTEDQYTTNSYETYSELDALGRCGVAIACIGLDIMPSEEREDSLSSVTPSGWEQVNYDGTYLYHRCHLIGFQLTGENANKKNLITGTGYFNVTGMLPFENQVDDYIEETGNHVLYRVTPIYEGNNLVANGVLMEAYSIEDDGEGVTFCVYVYNVQPGITIDYRTGASTNDGVFNSPDDDKNDTNQDKTDALITEEKLYVINISTRKFHLHTCTYAEKLNEDNREERTTTAKALFDEGHSACGVCLKGVEEAYRMPAD